VAIGMLRDDLLGLPGVEHAELDGDPMAPVGIRVRLAKAADAPTVAGEVRRVLAQHGLRPDGDAGEQQPLPTVAGVPSGAPPMGRDEGATAVVTTDRRLFSIAVAESLDGVVVTATGSSREASVRAAGISIPAIDHAVVQAAAEVFGAATLPLVCSVEERDLDGTSVLTLVVEESGQRLVGSAIVGSGRAYAVGRAVWAALSSR
jgi:hypothetical protein